MASFIYNPYSKEKRESQFKKYLQNQSFVNQIEVETANTGNLLEKVINVCSSEIKYSIENSSVELGKVIQSSLDVVCVSLDSGFNCLESKLTDLERHIGYGMYRIVEKLKITNSYLGKIEQLLKIPDDQKRRVYYIEEGLKYLKNAFISKEDADFYTDALEEFTKAREIEKKDFLSLYYIGFIHLTSINNIDLIEAESCFKSSARYFLAESTINGTSFTNNLLPQIDFIKEAAEAYFYAAEACSLQGKFSEAALLAEKAHVTYSGLIKAEFMQAKYLIADKKPTEAIPVLRSVLAKDYYFALNIASDQELICEPAVQSLLEELREQAVKYVRKKYTNCIEAMHSDSIAKKYLLDKESLINKNCFLEAKYAEDKLFQSHIWVLENTVSNYEKEETLPMISRTEFNGSVLDFVKIEKDNLLKIPSARKLIEIKNTEVAILQEEAKLLNMKKDSEDSNRYSTFNFCLIAALFSVVIAYLAIPYGGYNAVSFLINWIWKWTFILSTICFTYSFLSLGREIFVYENSIIIQKDIIDTLKRQLTELNIQINKLS